MEKRWHIIYVKESKEIKVASLLSSKHIENFCMVNNKPFNMLKGKIPSPMLFTSFVFAKFSIEEMEIVRKMRYVINLVYWKMAPIVVPDEYIHAIKVFDNKYQHISIKKIPIDLHTDKKAVRVITDISEELILPVIGYRLNAAVSERKKIDLKVVDGKGINESKNEPQIAYKVSSAK